MACNKKSQTTVLIVGIVLLLNSCSNKVENKEALTSYIQDKENNLVVENKAGGLDIKVTYKPTDLLVAQGLKKDKNQRVVDSLREKYGKYYYFILSYSKNGRDALRAAVKSQADYSAKLNVLSFGMQRYVRLAADIDTIPVKDYLYQNMFGASHATEVLIAFDKTSIKEETENLRFILDDIGFGTGRQVFDFRKENLDKVPEIDFKIETN